MYPDGARHRHWAAALNGQHASRAYVKARGRRRGVWLPDGERRPALFSSCFCRPQLGPEFAEAVIEDLVPLGMLHTCSIYGAGL